MRDGGLSPLGGEGKIVEADETYFGKMGSPTFLRNAVAVPIRLVPVARAISAPIVALVERGGNVRPFHVALQTRRQ